MLGYIALPVIWRGIAFRFGNYALRGGRRVAIHEFPTRDDPFTEHLGRKVRQYRLRGHIIGPLWEASRDALISACEDSSQVGTLVHPYLGPLQVRCVDYEVAEDKDNGLIANFDFLFVEAGEQPGPSSFINTALSVLRQVEIVIAEVQSAFMIGVALVQAPAALISVGWCTGLVGSLTALPLASEYSLASLLPGIVATPTDPAATAGAIVGVTGAYAQAIVDGTLSLASDQTGGLADLAAWGGDILAANTGSTPTLAQQAANAQATVDLVRGAAVAAVATVYAGIDWTSANAAAAARDQLAALLEDRTAAAAAGQDALYAAWQAQESIALQDLAQRVQQLPQLVPYTRAAPPPALALAYRLYQDATRATQLVQLNDAPHPLFMPTAGRALAASLSP
ncbi:MAG TPA: DNA circularization N-terminal domain-containing protein [Acetobacteraceae bacterium]|nr:DNA circularization N-terminal domain-containing protein [Acetobacteraceae bacterium]